MNHTIAPKTSVTANGVTVSYCLSCGFRHQDPLPAEEEVKKYYDDDTFYKVFAAKDWFEKEHKEHTAGLWNAYYDYQINLLRPLKIKRDVIDIVDVGCGAGWFVERAREQHFHQSFGIEPSQAARDVLKRDYIVPEYTFGYCAAIHLSLVLEHLRDPKIELMKWRDKLIYNGRILVTVPNEFSPLQKKLGTYHFISKVHLSYFEPATLQNLMHSCGFRIIHESATFPFELFELLGIHYIGNDLLGRKCHRLRLQFEKMLGMRAFDLYQKLYQRYGWGRELICLGEKI